MSGPIRYEAAGGVAEIVFDRPEVLNALDRATAEGFVAAVDRALGDPAVRVVLLMGEGRAFMAGGDLASMRAPQTRRAGIEALIGPLHGALIRLAQAPAITIAAAQGPVAGAGMSVFLGADLGIVADDAVLTLAYSKIGTSPDCGGSHALMQLVGLRKAMEIALFSDTIPAEEAVRLGLANRMVPAAALRADARAMAARLAAGPALAQGRIKALLRGAAGRGMAEQLGAEAESFLALSASDDFSEGINAFFDKRKPAFRGR
jgi:2-(1,2-epoxy-1,2-dihydrophenyl)acetyl-CoA isomerase